MIVHIAEPPPAAIRKLLRAHKAEIEAKAAITHRAGRKASTPERSGEWL